MKFFLLSVITASLSFLSGLSVSAQQSQRDHIPYDDSTLTSLQGPYAMPYNRWIDPAGITVRFGDPKLENHSLDAILLPGGEILAVEDRYGIILFKANGHQVMARYSFTGDRKYGQLMSTYSGIKAIRYKGAVHLFWGAGHGTSADSYVMEAVWDGNNLDIVQAIPFPAMAPAPMALPNEVLVREENGDLYLYVVLNGSNQLTKLRARDQAISWTSPTGVAPYGLTMAGGKIFVTNWAGPVPSPIDTVGKETAGVPWGSAYTDPRTGATSRGTVTVIDPGNGKFIRDIEVGLHPSAIIHSPDEQTVFVANGNSDYISVIHTATLEVADTIPVSPFEKSDHYAGSTPCALAIDPSASRLYVANGMNNAVAVIGLRSHKPVVLGFIPTEAWPSGIVADRNTLYVTNLEAIGSRSKQNNAYNSHWQQASVSWIPVPDAKQLESYTTRVRQLNLSFRETMARQLP
ncbi:MAG TPA: YncE family protein, partial [Puia sp.]|nr:YncE family protein [Puia sp.]